MDIDGMAGRTALRWCWVLTLWLGAEVQAQPGIPPATVVTAPVEEREIAAGQTFVGQVVPSRRSVVGSAVDGRVVELLVNDGDHVGLEKENGNSRPLGQPMVQLLTETISIEIEAAKATAELRRHELAEMENGTRPEEKAQAKAKLEGAQALQAFTQSQLERIRTLHEKSKATSKEQLDEAISVAVNAFNNYLAAKAAHEMAEAGPRREQIAQARARLAVAEEEVKRLEDQRRKYTIRAPFAGQVITKMTEVGAWVTRGNPVAEVIALDPAEIEVTVPEAYIPHVLIGAETRIQVDALPGQSLTGKVARIVPQADLRSRSFPVKIRLPNSLGADGNYPLKSGMLARVTMAVGPRQKALLVPKDAIVLGGPSPLVMVVTPNPQTKQQQATPVPIQLGVATEGLIQVLGELQPGQPVIVVGNERVRPGQPVVAAGK